MKILVAVAVAFLFQSLDTGQRAFREKDWVAAERIFGEWVAKHPRDPVGYRWLGMTYGAQEKYALALPNFEKSCTLKRSDGLACYYWARSLFLTNRFEEALRVYRSLDALNGRALLGMAMTLEALGRLEEADGVYKRAAETVPEATLEYQKFKRRKSAPQLNATEIRFHAADLPVTIRDGAKGEKRLPETMIAGAAVFDYNNDGRLDVYLARGGLLRNEGGGRFVDVTEAAGLSGSYADMGVVAGDYDGDGFLDLFVTGLRCQRLYRNTGRGTFEEVTARAGVEDRRHWTVAAAWLDADSDGRLDLFVVRYVDYDEASEAYCGTDKIRQYCDPRLYKPSANALYRNLGDGRFA
ncbi:MAG: VCBS repeat-containing protein, partial [Bryobacterales bacterium]|nr:VCBS repeat-containing protein [Bryobacterales bacterium]